MAVIDNYILISFNAFYNSELNIQVWVVFLFESAAKEKQLW